MTHTHETRMAARQAEVRRVRMALEARIREKLDYACSGAVYNPLLQSGRLKPRSVNREFGVWLDEKLPPREPTASRGRRRAPAMDSTRDLFDG